VRLDLELCTKSIKTDLLALLSQIVQTSNKQKKETQKTKNIKTRCQNRAENLFEF